MSKKYSQKDYEDEQKRILKMKNRLEKIKRENPKLALKVESKNDVKEKLDAINSTIGYIVRKSLQLDLPLHILIDIANDYERKLKEG
jgi:predicted RNase H-like nuclease (RuvC/YqgF family)